MNVSIIIVSYNTKKLLQECLESILTNTKDLQYEIIVSDNGSTDGSVEMVKAIFPCVILIENNENLGFGAANNRGLLIAKGKYIFYLNSDTILLNNAVKLFFDYWEKNDSNETLGALGCNLVNDKNITSISYCSFPRFMKSFIYIIKMYIKIVLNKKIIRHPVYSTLNKETEVDVISGADLFLKNTKDAFFDEDYFLYYEETDLEYKLYKKKLVRKIIPTPRIIHLQGSSNKQKNEPMSFGDMHSLYSLVLYFHKHGLKFQTVILKSMVVQVFLLKNVRDRTNQVLKKLRELS